MKRMAGGLVAIMLLSGCSLASSATEERTSAAVKKKTECYSFTELEVLVKNRAMFPTGIDAHGDVVGSTGGGDSERHGFLWRNGTTTDLGAGSQANAVNDNRQITGWMLALDGNRHAFRWDAGVATDLGTLDGVSSEGVAINGAGEVVGTSGAHAFLWDGALTDLGTLGGSMSTVAAINDNTQIVGTSETTTSGVMHAYLWENGVMHDLGSLGGNSEAVAINPDGVVVGTASLSGVSHAVYWQNGTIHDLGVASDTSSAGVAINGTGQIAGTFVSGGVVHGFFWSGGTRTDVGSLGVNASTDTYATGLDDGGRVVGLSSTDDGRVGAFLWAGGTLQELPRPPKVVEFDNVLVSPRGRLIAGEYRAAGTSGKRRTLVWAPRGPCVR